MAVRAPRDSEWATRKTLIDKRLQAAKTFRGELAGTEAALTRRDGRSYETADLLLARVESVTTMGGSMPRAMRTR